jgi:hypothetical protein
VYSFKIWSILFYFHSIVESSAIKLRSSTSWNSRWRNFDRRRSWKGNNGCDKWSKVEIYIFFSFCSSFSPHNSRIEYQVIGNCVLLESLSRLLQHISNTRRSSRFRVVGEKEPMERMVFISRTYFTSRNLLKFQSVEQNKHVERVLSSALIWKQIYQNNSSYYSI